MQTTRSPINRDGATTAPQVNWDAVLAWFSTYEQINQPTAVAPVATMNDPLYQPAHEAAATANMIQIADTQAEPAFDITQPFIEDHEFTMDDTETDAAPVNTQQTEASDHEQQTATEDDNDDEDEDEEEHDQLPPHMVDIICPFYWRKDKQRTYLVRYQRRAQLMSISAIRAFGNRVFPPFWIEYQGIRVADIIRRPSAMNRVLEFIERRAEALQ